MSANYFCVVLFFNLKNGLLLRNNQIFFLFCFDNGPLFSFYKICIFVTLFLLLSIFGIPCLRGVFGPTRTSVLPIPLFSIPFDSDSWPPNRFSIPILLPIPSINSRFQSIILWNRFRNQNRRTEIGIGSTLN